MRGTGPAAFRGRWRWLTTGGWPPWRTPSATGTALSPQAAWLVLGESYGVQTTIAEVEDALEASSCDHCPASAPEPARQQQSPPAAVHQLWDGWLTGMLLDDG
jgi:hypothetical protein